MPSRPQAQASAQPRRRSDRTLIISEAQAGRLARRTAKTRGIADRRDQTMRPAAAISHTESLIRTLNNYNLLIFNGFYFRQSQLPTSISHASTSLTTDGALNPFLPLLLRYQSVAVDKSHELRAFGDKHHSKNLSHTMPHMR